MHLIIPKNIMKTITIWDTVTGISCLLGGLVLLWGRREGGGASNALNRLNNSRENFEVRSPIG